MTTVQRIHIPAKPTRVLQNYKSPAKPIREEASETQVSSVASLPKARVITPNQECSSSAAEKANQLYSDAKSESTDEKLDKREQLENAFKKDLFSLHKEKADLLRRFLNQCADVLERESKKPLPAYAAIFFAYIFQCQTSEVDRCLEGVGLLPCKALFQPGNRTWWMQLTIPTKEKPYVLGFAYCPMCKKMSLFDTQAWKFHHGTCQECEEDFDFHNGGDKSVEIVPGCRISAASFIDQVRIMGFGQRSQVANCALTPPAFVQRAAREIDLLKTLDRIEIEVENREHAFHKACKES